MARRSRTNLKRIGTKIAQGAVVRNLSGNMQQNAINARDVQQGAIIYVDDTIAPYGYILNSGAVPGKGQDHKGWWTKARDGMAVLFNSAYNGRKTSLSSTIDRVNANSKDNLARQVTYLRNIRRK